MSGKTLTAIQFSSFKDRVLETMDRSANHFYQHLYCEMIFWCNIKQEPYFQFCSWSYTINLVTLLPLYHIYSKHILRQAIQVIYRNSYKNDGFNSNFVFIGFTSILLLKKWKILKGMYPLFLTFSKILKLLKFILLVKKWEKVNIQILYCV